MASASDDFTRADSSSLGVNWTTVDQTSAPGSGWGDAGLRITSNAVVPEINLSSDRLEFWNADTFGADQYSQAAMTVTSTVTVSGPGVSVRASAAGNGYMAWVSKAASNNVEVAKFTGGGTYTLIGRRTTTWADGDVLRLEVQGSTLRVYQNGAQLGADFSDTALTTGQPGLTHASGGATVSQMDNWSGGDLAVAGGSTQGPQRLLTVGAG